jgi:hypothetical protein
VSFNINQEIDMTFTIDRNTFRNMASKTKAGLKAVASTSPADVAAKAGNVAGRTAAVARAAYTAAKAEAKK